MDVHKINANRLTEKRVFHERKQSSVLVKNKIDFLHTIFMCRIFYSRRDFSPSMYDMAFSLSRDVRSVSKSTKRGSRTEDSTDAVDSSETLAIYSTGTSKSLAKPMKFFIVGFVFPLSQLLTDGAATPRT